MQTKPSVPQAQSVAGSAFVGRGVGVSMRCAPLFSPEDADLAKLTWHLISKGYAARKFDGRTQYAHRIILARILGRPPTSEEHTDHLNRNKLDNRRENLMAVTRQMNAQNCNSHCDPGRTGIPRGASFFKPCKKWASSVYTNGKRFHLGYFSTAEEAGEVARKKRIELGFHGERSDN